MKKESEIITIEKVKKDGSISKEILHKIVSSFFTREYIFLPVDGIYGMGALSSKVTITEFTKKLKLKDYQVVTLISSFKMLEELASVDKNTYDFLHRVWPGEIVVKLNRKDSPNEDSKILISFPKIKYINDTIKELEVPLLFAAAKTKRKLIVFKKMEIKRKYKDRADLIFIINELCKDYPLPSFVDLTGEKMKIIKVGKLSVEEIKSLYFLG